MRSHYPRVIRGPLSLFAGIGSTLLALAFLAATFAPGASSGATAETGTTTMSASQATYVSRAYPTANYGTQNEIWADANPQNRGLVQFDLGAVPTDASITGATLKVYVTNYSPTAGTVSAAGSTWMASSVTWNNAPPIGPQVGALQSPATLATWRSTTISAAAVQAGRDGRRISFYVTSTDTDGVFYGKGVSGPSLAVRWTRAGSSTATPTASSTPSATPTPGSSTTVIAAGDIADCSSSGDEATANLVKGIGGTVLALGDNVYESGAASEFRSCYDPSWGQFKSRTKPAVGNHEYLTSGASGYFDYFGAAAGPAGKGWYAYNQGSWRLYALNSNCSKIVGCGPGSPEYEWLKADLAANPHSCVLAYWHHPLFTNGPHANNEGGGAGDLWSLLYQANAEIVLNGHDHHYQRWAPQRPDGQVDGARGIREFVVGTGGAGLTSPNRTPANLEVGRADTFGVLVLTLKSGGYTWKFTPVAGKTFTDSGSGNCH